MQINWHQNTPKTCASLQNCSYDVYSGSYLYIHHQGQSRSINKDILF